MRLHQATVVITGGSKGIGLATARACIREGARVVVTGRDEQRLRAAGAELGVNASAVRADIRSVDDLDALYAMVQQQYDLIDVLFANAGLMHYEPLDQITSATCDAIIDTNVKGTFFTIQRALPFLRRGASIIVNASIAHRAGTSGGALYAGSKAAVRAMARNFSSELAPRQIRVNAISPGPIARTDIRSPSNPFERQGPFLSIPAMRTGTADEVAELVVFLASNASRFIVGANIAIDGGRTELPDGAPVFDFARIVNELDPALAAAALEQLRRRRTELP